MSHDHLSHGHHDHMSHGVGSPSMGQMDHSSHMGHMGHDMGGMNMTNCTHHHMDMDMSMSMWFHLGYKETILFEFWKVSTVYGLVGSMIGICIMAALYEGLKYYREHLFWHSYNALQYRSVQMPVDKSSSDRVVQPSMFSKMHAFQTFLHIIQMVISYFLMLIFMTYNVYLCIAVVIGAGIGYFLFGWKKSVIVDVTEHCH